MRSELRVILRDRGDGSVTFALEFEYPQPQAAQGTVTDLVAALQQPMQAEGTMEVVSPASLSRGRAESNRGKTIVFGLLFGLLGGLFTGTLWTLVRKRRQWMVKRIAGFAAAGMVVGAGISFAIPDEYVSTAVIRSSVRMDDALVHRVLADDVLARIIRDDGLYVHDLEHRPIPEAVKRMRKDLRIQRLGVGADDAFTVSFRNQDRMLTERVTRDLVSVWLAAGPAIGARFEVLDPANPPSRPSSPNRPQIAGLGVLVGALLGIGAARFRRPSMVGA